MTKNFLFPIFLALILLSCLNGVQGQYSDQSGSYPTSTPITENSNIPTSANPLNASVTAGTKNSPYDYSQYYTMSSSPQNAHISTPEEININRTIPPTIVYLSNQMQPVSYALYSSDLASANSTYLWIQGTKSWSQYAAVPQGATVLLLAISPKGGNGYMTFMDADGKTYTYNYYFYPYSRLTFYADLPGRPII